MQLTVWVFAGAVTALIAIWFGYPLLVAAAAAIRSRDIRPVRSVDTHPSISVILATREAAEAIVARIDDIVRTRYPRARIQVIVAIDHTGAKTTPDAVERRIPAAIVTIGDEPGGKAAALNAGVRRATGELLLFCDTAQRFDAETIPELVAALGDRRFGAVSGALTLGAATGRLSPVHLYWGMEKWLRRNEARLHSSIGVTGAVYAMRRELWTPIPAGTLLDDVFVPMSLVLRGWRVGFLPTAHAFDQRAFNADAEADRKTRTLTGVLQLVTLLPGLLSPVRNPVALQFIAHKLLRLLTPLLTLLALLAGTGAVLPTLARLGTVGWAMLGGMALLLVAVEPSRRRLFAGARWIVAMQMAVLRALYNGVTGRWSVWVTRR